MKDQFSYIFCLDIWLSIPSGISNLAGQNTNSMFHLEHGNFIMMSTEQHFYFGKFLGIFKQTASNCYWYVDDATAALRPWVHSVSKIRFLTGFDFWSVYRPLIDKIEESTTPTFTGHYCGHELHIHAPINHLVYHCRASQIEPKNTWGWQTQGL